MWLAPQEHRKMLRSSTFGRDWLIAKPLSGTYHNGSYCMTMSIAQRQQKMTVERKSPVQMQIFRSTALIQIFLRSYVRSMIMLL